MTKQIQYFELSNGAFFQDERCTIFIGKKNVIVSANNKEYFFLGIHTYDSFWKLASSIHQEKGMVTPSMILDEMTKPEPEEFFWDRF